MKEENQEQQIKVCSKCAKTKDVSEFYTYKKTGNPWAYCKSCHYTLYTKETKYNWDKKNPERVKELHKKCMKNWITKNPERWKEIQHKAYLKYRAKIKAKHTEET